MIKPEIQRVALGDELLVSEWALCIGSSFKEIMPITKLSHPMTYCDTANSLMMCGMLRAVEHLAQMMVPLPRRYLGRSDHRLRCVLFFSIHISTPVTDCMNACVHPVLGHLAMCLHNSKHSRQLGHKGLLISWCKRKCIVPATPRTCLAAHT